MRFGSRGRERGIGVSGLGTARLGSRKRREAENAAVVVSPTVTATDITGQKTAERPPREG
jgi:hypothetical protein